MSCSLFRLPSHHTYTHTRGGLWQMFYTICTIPMFPVPICSFHLAFLPYYPSFFLSFQLLSILFFAHHLHIFPSSYLSLFTMSAQWLTTDTIPLSSITMPPSNSNHLVKLQSSPFSQLHLYVSGWEAAVVWPPEALLDIKQLRHMEIFFFSDVFWWVALVSWGMTEVTVLF